MMESKSIKQLDRMERIGRYDGECRIFKITIDDF